MRPIVIISQLTRNLIKLVLVTGKTRGQIITVYPLSICLFRELYVMYVFDNMNRWLKLNERFAVTTRALLQKLVNHDEKSAI